MTGLTNDLRIRPDLHGDPLQRYAAHIAAIDPNAICPTNPREARALLDELQRRQRQPRPDGNDLRLTQIHEAWNGLLPQLQKAKRLGILARDAAVPKIPEGGIVSPDDLQTMLHFSGQLDADIAAFEAQTPDQRRIGRLEADLAMAYAKLARAHNEHETRIVALEAIIRGEQVAA